MTKYESSVKHIPYPVESVYEKLSDMNNLEILRQTASDPAMRDLLLQQMGDKADPTQIDQMAQLLQGMQLTADTMTVDVSMLGNITLRIVEREWPKLVKCETEGSPVQATLWMQLLPEGEAGSALKVTLGAELNFFMKQMLKGKLQSGVEKFADMLAMLHY